MTPPAVASLLDRRTSSYKPTALHARTLCAWPLAFAACSSSPSGTLQIVTGAETDTFSRLPQPLQLEVDLLDTSGTRRTLASVSLPTSSIDLGAQSSTAVGTLQVTGAGSGATRLIYGQSLPILLGSLDGVTVPVFVQRTGEFARLPAPLSDTRQAPTLAIVADRYLFVGGGDTLAAAQSTQFYDFASLAPLATTPALPRVPKSVAFVGTSAWIIDENGATGFDFGSSVSFEIMTPAGGSLSDVAGGATVVATDGSQYVVGATRGSGTPSKTVLALDPKGTPSWVTLSEARLGAAATWVDGRGLVVAGGGGMAGAGVEIVAPGTPVGTPLSYPADPSTGSGAATLDGQHVLLAGGLTPSGQDAGFRTLDLACSMQCSPAPWAPLPEGALLVRAQAFASDAANALAVGDDATGKTTVYRLSQAMVTPVATKVVHLGARAIVSPLGSVVVFGGAGEIESFVP